MTGTDQGFGPEPVPPASKGEDGADGRVEDVVRGCQERAFLETLDSR